MSSNNTIVMCMKCQHTFMTKTQRPQCSSCGSRMIKRAEDVPKLYGVKDIGILKTEFETYKKENVEVINILLDRIELIEDKV